jgi:hypothetical protein
MNRALFLVVVLIAALLVACGDDDDESNGGEATTPGVTEADSATPTKEAGAADTVFSSSQLPIQVTVTAGDDFINPEEADVIDVFVIVQPQSPGGWIDFLQPTQVYYYTSETQSELRDPPTDYVQWFNDLPYPTIAETAEVIVGGVQGTRLKITNSDNEDFALFRMTDGTDYELDYTGSGAVVAYVFNVNGTQVLSICGTEAAAAFSQFEPTCDEVVNTAEFGD